MQFEILKLTLKKNIKNIIIFYIILTFSFIILLYFNKYPSNYYNYILGFLDLTNHFSIILWLFNISFIILILYKFITFDIKNMPDSLILRENNKTWITKKLIYSCFLTFLLKIVEYIFFHILSTIFNISIIININFYILDLYLNITYILLLLNLILLKNKLPLITNIISIILIINKLYYLSILFTIITIYLIIKLYKFNKN